MVRHYNFADELARDFELQLDVAWSSAWPFPDGESVLDSDPPHDRSFLNSDPHWPGHVVPTFSNAPNTTFEEYAPEMKPPDCTTRGVQIGEHTDATKTVKVTEEVLRCPSSVSYDYNGQKFSFFITTSNKRVTAHCTGMMQSSGAVLPCNAWSFDLEVDCVVCAKKREVQAIQIELRNESHTVATISLDGSEVFRPDLKGAPVLSLPAIEAEVVKTVSIRRQGDVLTAELNACAAGTCAQGKVLRNASAATQHACGILCQKTDRCSAKKDLTLS